VKARCLPGRYCRVKTCRNAKKGKASDLAGHVRTPMQEW
jgi:hypothetical protein